MSRFHSYDPAAGHGLPHDPFKAIVAPRPVGWVTTIDRDGRINLAPYSFFNAFSTSPPIVGFSSEGRKDSILNAMETGEFTFNLVSLPLIAAMNATSAPTRRGVNEMELAALEALPSSKVKPPRVMRSPAAMECKVVEVKALSDINGDLIGAYLVIGQVVQVHIDERYLVDGIFDIVAAQTVARAGYRGDYISVTATFELLRPETAPGTG
jgi:flavin reductase (DIM6/NTAB) family NADH-FMN oxidoreductase RutF